ncbi:unnamed protein product [Psylliodes chrysocephalus]|uniref:Uncharacterized protein n=1 Tax=Psylliodes chrysocephalus TaxID=3402493 RepID=A0A9P0G5Y8_9CUCU|nr:unnamed protein product [Psylliodes chrysocephala]
MGVNANNNEEEMTLCRVCVQNDIDVINKSSPSSFEAECSKKHEWTSEESRFLLDYYGESLPLVGSNKTFGRSAKKLIPYKLNSSLTWVQCENRYKTILERKKA